MRGGRLKGENVQYPSWNGTVGPLRGISLAGLESLHVAGT